MKGEVAVSVHMDIIDEWDSYSATVREMAHRAVVEAGAAPTFRVESGTSTVLVIFGAIR